MDVFSKRVPNENWGMLMKLTRWVFVLAIDLYTQ
jgi:hypothetical protein